MANESMVATALALRVAVAEPREHADVSLLVDGARPTTDAYVRFGKPLIDRFAAVVLLLVVLPVLAAVAVAVWLDLGGPVLLRQRRVGKDGRAFTMLKFRTMRPDRRARGADPYAGPERRTRHKHPDDPRLTRLGRLLRSLSLDELPQLWNVLRGEMSLVGPRPELPLIVDRYESWQHQRHAVRPGLTGLWQISERGSGGDMHEHVDIDLEYVDRLSLRTDLGILVRTLPAALGKHRGF